MNKKRSSRPSRPAKINKKNSPVRGNQNCKRSAGNGLRKKGANAGRGNNRDISEYKKMGEALRDNEQKFTKIFQNNASAISLIRLRDGVILDVNGKWEKMFGLLRRQVIGKTTARDLLVWKDPGERKRVYGELRARRSIQNRECKLVRKNRETWTALLSAEIIQLQGEAVVIGSLQDITSMKRMEEENRNLAKFPDENPNPVMRLTPKGAILYANAASRTLMGSRKHGRDILVPKVLRRAISETGAAKSSRTICFEINGRIFIFDILPIPETGYINVYGRDETEHKQDEAALRTSEERYHSLFTTMTEGFALHEIICNKRGIPIDYLFLEINPAFEELTGLKRRAVIGHLFSELLPGEDLYWIKVFGKVALTGKPAQFENYSSVLKKHYNVFAFSPAPKQFAVLFTDVSEERKKQTELQKLNRTLKALSDSSQAMMQATDEVAFLTEICRIIVTDCGHKLAWIGYKENDKEKSVRPVAHAGFEKGYLETLRLTWANTERGRGPTGMAIRTGKPVICRNMLKDPHFTPWREEARRRGYNSSIALPLLASGRAFGAMMIYSHDMDPFLPAEVELLSELAERLAFGIQALRLRQEHSKAEQALQETSNYLEKLLNYANAPIIVWDPSFRIIRFNHAFERLTGHAAAQVHGKPLDMLFPPASKNESLRLIRDTLTGKHWEIVEIPILQKSGAIRTVLWNSANIHDKDGAVIATIAQGQDITERKQTEEQVAASLHEKEILLRELYHRTKNNMNVISSLVTLQSAALNDPIVLRMFKDMQSRIHTMSLVHEKLYQSSDLFNLDIREYINDLAKTILTGYKNSVARISLNLDIESVPFSIDTALPCGLVINELITNSLKYAFAEEMTGEIGISLQLSPEDEVILCYHDNGIGFPDGFDPLKASSLGLKLVHNLVRKQLLGKLEFKATQGIWVEIRFKKTNIEKPESMNHEKT